MKSILQNRDDRLTKDPKDKASFGTFGDAKASESSRTKLLIWARLVCCGTSLSEGYAMGIWSGASGLFEAPLQISHGQMAILTASIAMFMPVGAAVSGICSDKYGRRPTIVGSYLFIALGCVLCAIAGSFATLLLGRMITAVGIGWGVTVISMYIAEIAPCEDRGRMVGLEELFIVFGNFIGAVAVSLLVTWENPMNWRIMFAIGIILPLVLALLIVLGFIPESPRYLAMRGQSNEARQVLCEIVSSEEADYILKNWDAEMAGSQAVSWRKTFFPSSRQHRYMMLAAVGAMLLQQIFSGATLMTNYLTRIMAEDSRMSYAHAARVQTYSKLVQTIATIGCLAVIDKVGRRTLLISSCCLLACGYAFAGVSFAQNWNVWWFQSVSLAIVAASHDVGFGPVPWVYSFEVLPTELRSKGGAIAIGISRLFNSFLLLGFEPLLYTVGAEWGFAFFALINFTIALPFIIFFLPETSGVTLEDIPSLFKAQKEGDAAGG